MTARTRILTGLIVLTLVAAGFTLWFTSADQRRHRLVDDLLAGGAVDAVVLERGGIREIVFDADANAGDVRAAWDRLKDEHVWQVMVGEVRVEANDVASAAPVALAVADLRVDPTRLRVREVGDGMIWLEAGFFPTPEGMAEPTPADGAAAVLKVLEALDPDALPEGLDLVAAHRIPEQLDLVIIHRTALVRLEATIADLQRVAASDPAERITCDAEGCRTE